jgi:hypothetical protein
MFVLFLLGSAACQTTAPPAVPTAAASANQIGDDFNPQPGLITWLHDPNYVLFRAEIIGGEDPFLVRNVIPECTIYGDNRIVWQTNLDSSDSQILEDRLSDETISAFIQYLTVNERIFTYTEKLPEVAAQYEVAPVVERVTIAVNDIPHRADSLSGWDIRWFDRVLNACQHLSIAPVLVLPTGGWLTTEEVAYDPQPPLAIWSAERTGIGLADYLGETPGWITGEGVAELWQLVRSLPLTTLYLDGERYFRVALQVPGTTRASPRHNTPKIVELFF